MDGWVVGWMGGWMGGWLGGWVSEWVDWGLGVDRFGDWSVGGRAYDGLIDGGAKMYV